MATGEFSRVTLGALQAFVLVAFVALQARVALSYQVSFFHVLGFIPTYYLLLVSVSMLHHGYTTNWAPEPTEAHLKLSLIWWFVFGLSILSAFFLSVTRLKHHET